MEPPGPPLPNRKSVVKSILFLLPLLVVAWLVRRHGEAWLRYGLLYLSTAGWARQLVSSLPLSWRVANRFVAGTEREAALEVTRQLNARGMSVTLDFLGEGCTSPQEARAARDEIRTLLGRIHETGVSANVSLKLSQLGLHLQEQLALENLLSILDCAQQHNNRVRIDMEDSPTIDAALRIYHTARDQRGYNNVGVVIQSYLYRSEEDICQLVKEGAWIRLVKGAYAEPPEVAYPIKADTDANFIKLSRMMMSEDARRNGVYPAIATHDEKMIEDVTAYAKANSIPTEAYEFQMLYGIRRELQESLVKQGYQMRIYVPYGTAWYPYFVRRLAERPANLWFFLSNFFRR
jgi:proline dehydrogenase